MIPLELMKDSDGILFMNNINHRDVTKFPYQQNTFKYQFFNIPSTDEYILKYYKFNSLYSDLVEMKTMLMELNKRRNKLEDIDFPIGYYLEEDELKGAIVYYYKKALSLRDFSILYSLEDLQKYYFHDDNMHRNLVMLYLDILNLLEKMMDEKMYYLDVHSGNFVMYNNNVKVIDFEPRQLAFNDEFNNYYQSILICFKFLVNFTNNKLGLENALIDDCSNINILKGEVKKLEKRLK